jgi:hypothetical protein
MQRSLLLLTFVLATSLSQQAVPHHSAVVFENDRTILQTGVVSEFIFRNPHLIIRLDVTDDSGETETWNIEGQSIAGMQAMGFDRNSISVGDEITMKIYPLRSGRPGGLVEGLIGADGRAYNMEAPPSAQRQTYPALMEWVPPPEGETWQEREAKTRPPQLPIVSLGQGPGEAPGAGLMAGALDPDNLAAERPPAAFDLTGVWRFRGEDEWRANYGSFEFKPKPKLTPKGQAYLDEYLQASERGERFGDPTALCYPPGMPRFMTRYGSLMMLQYPTAIFMVSRLNNDYRVIYLDGRERLPEGQLDRNWHGESLGHWEDDTLVVETTGFIGENHLIQAGILAGEQLKIVERYQMINDGNTLAIEFTFTDPEHWEGEWKHVKFRDRVLRSDVREANCIYTDNQVLPGMD